MTKITRKSRRDWVPRFLARLGKTANVGGACKSAGISRNCAYERRRVDPDFAAAWDTAIENAIDALEDTCRKRAEKGSDVLAIFLLKAHRPAKYRERYGFTDETERPDPAKAAAALMTLMGVTLPPLALGEAAVDSVNDSSDKQ